ncbi:dihydropteroate synthase [candidate division KSB1 bacterium]|nr:dihydropteroate synthase [candidate division KSB1 bacterium]
MTMPIRKKYLLSSRNKTLILGENTTIMGIVNCTPDSFSDGGQFQSPEDAATYALKLIKEGADIVDIGGESTRPGSDPVSESEELERVIPVIEQIRKVSDVWISIDTCKANVAHRAVEVGADMINDISGLRFDSKMAGVAAAANVPVIAMHILGNPKTMQEKPVYDDVVKTVFDYFSERIYTLVNQGIKKANIIIDPGIGFGKTTEHNLTLLNYLSVLSKLDMPILVGPSRKSFLGNILALSVDNLLEGTAAAVALSINRGAHIVRVHDVKEMVRVSRVTDAIIKSPQTGIAC